MLKYSIKIALSKGLFYTYEEDVSHRDITFSKLPSGEKNYYPFSVSANKAGKYSAKVALHNTNGELLDAHQIIINIKK